MELVGVVGCVGPAQCLKEKRVREGMPSVQSILGQLAAEREDRQRARNHHHHLAVKASCDDSGQSLSAECIDLTETDDEHNDGSNTMNAASRALVMKLAEYDRKRQSAEDAAEEQSLLVARELHEQESTKRHRPEQEWQKADLELARQLDEEERDTERRVQRAHAPITKEQVLAQLSPCQLNAMEFVDWKAEKLHVHALAGLKSRVIQLGFTDLDLNRCLAYIRDDAPIIVHFTEATLNFLTKDPWYRSQFETATSRGTLTQARTEWENKMFGDMYAEASGAEHPKYGCLNVTGDIRGVRCAHCYGPLFMTLSPAVRHRTSFANEDTAGGMNTLASNEFYAQVLARYSDPELSAALGLSRVAGGPSTSIAQYKECQIHGSLSIADDVAGLSVPGREAGASCALKQAVEAFRKISNCNVMWQDDLQ